jgi:hypothetical protein
MRSQESLSLPDQLEISHSSLPSPSRFMRLLCSVILILLSTVGRLWCQLMMSDAITAQLVRHDLPGLTAM